MVLQENKVVLQETKLITTEQINIEDMIYEIRGKQVMLDSDLAKLYKCKNGTKSINQAVKRNINRFPERFMFQLTEEEYKKLQSQFGTTNNMSRSLPFAFTEEGVAMIATILKTSVAIQVSINIMDAFVRMRHYLIENKDIIPNRILLLENKVDYIDNNVKLLQETFNKLGEQEEKNKIYFKGQRYDAYSFLLDILNSSKKEIIIIDNYVNKNVLDLISKTKKNVIIVSENMNEELIKKYQSQYDNLTIIQKDEFHDRFIIIDRKKLYNLGSSLKDLGNKGFSINIINDTNYINSLLDKINVK